MQLLTETIAKIAPLDWAAMEAARRRLDELTKPRGSLGLLEEIAVRLAGMAGEPMPAIGRKVVILMAADHGVAEEGVSAYPQEVTRQMLLNFARGGAGINVLARHVGAEVVVVDIGVRGRVAHPAILDRKVREGTANIANGPAMTREEAIAAIEVGIEIARQTIGRNDSSGLALLATGEMGIGNTTAATAVLAAFSGFPVARLVGPGTGLDEEGVRQKAKVIRRALEINRPDPRDGLEVLAKLGGLEIAGLVGCVLAAAAARTPVLLDGFISGAAALVAARLAPQCLDYVFASHLSAEPGHRVMLEMMGLRPLLALDLRLGEGTGAVLAMPIIEAATKIIKEMATFTEAGVSGPAMS
ncbi:MAG: nicotinate-nucleotide--dimethylbenzimidazole phosphoribosyltransferase [Firmicutes bacterium]|nr:nicotinate-nucleotide--dimethylbenzimidazole phosphoribosyltransferase [Bacillota bacterium]